MNKSTSTMLSIGSKNYIQKIFMEPGGNGDYRVNEQGTRILRMRSADGRTKYSNTCYETEDEVITHETLTRRTRKGELQHGYSKLLEL